MRRKRKIEEHDSSDRWVVSYADFITLLFALFTTLYAISHVDLGKLKLFTGSVKTAFRAAGIDAINPAVIEGVKPINYADISLERDVRSEFNKFGIIESITISLDQRGVLLSFGDTLLFDSDSAEPRREGRPLLAAVASLIKKSQRSIVIEGHTDNIPLRGTRYSSNIELSAARAARTYSFLVDEEAVNPERMSASGYGEYRPIASNATVEGRARNRRVDIIFVAKKDGS
jgi:chemotaxis protein MotB